MDHLEELKKMLEPGETILWSARPDPWKYTLPTFMIYIVGLPWTIFTFFWLKTISGGFHWPAPAKSPIPAWAPYVAVGTGWVLLLAGIWMLNAPYWIWRRGKRTIYALTSQRAIALELGSPKRSEIMMLHGKIDLRVIDPGEPVSDLNVVCDSGKGVLFRAVKDPTSVVERIKNRI
jgi:hypothetical protein